jgi:hypothetical protein
VSLQDNLDPRVQPMETIGNREQTLVLQVLATFKGHHKQKGPATRRGLFETESHS